MEENKEQKNNGDTKVLRTYTSDMARVIRENEITAIKIAVAEKEKKEEEAMYRKQEGLGRPKLFMIIGGILLITIAIVVSLLLTKKTPVKEVVVTPVEKIEETFISYDYSLDIDVKNIADTSELAKVIGDVTLGENKTKAFFLTKKIAEIPEKLTVSEFVALVSPTMPEALSRSLSNNYLLGKISDTNAPDGKNSTFIIFETTNYNQVYRSMLDWEKIMLVDLSNLFGTQIKDNSAYGKKWKDVMIDNKDVRVLYGKNGEELLAYAFVNKNDFIITNNINSLREIINKVITKNK